MGPKMDMDTVGMRKIPPHAMNWT